MKGKANHAWMTAVVEDEPWLENKLEALIR